MVSLLEAVFLSVIQGITEWFPVSSSGHLALLHHFFGFQNLSFDVFLHFASILAIVIIFWKDIISLFNLSKRENLSYILFIVIAIIPAFIFGILLKEYIIASFQSFLFLGFFFIFSGIIIYSTKFAKEKKLRMRGAESLFIGLMQVFALFPGISRSGMTISAGLFAGLKKQEAIKFSFLLAIPVILGASLAEATHVLKADVSYLVLIVSFIVTFLVSLVTIRLLIKVIRSDRFYLFGIYNFVLGVLALGRSFFI